MSILHYFGKVTASYKKYEGDLPQYTGYVYNTRYLYNQGYLRNKESDKEKSTHMLDEIMKREEKVTCNPQIPDRFLYQHDSRFGSFHLSYTYYHLISPEKCVFSFTTLAETFSKCFEKVREKMYSDLWKTIECCPFINIMDLLLLKQSDTDKHIEHLEQMMCSLMEDNKLLQNRINALETKRVIPVTVGELLCDA